MCEILECKGAKFRIRNDVGNCNPNWKQEGKWKAQIKNGFLHNSNIWRYSPNQVVWRSSYQQTNQHIKYEGKFPNLTLSFDDKIYGLPCVAEQRKPPHVLITANEPLPTNTYQAHFRVIAPSICTFNMSTTGEKQKVRREGNEVTHDICWPCLGRQGYHV